MSTLVTRAGKGSPLTNLEVDTNFANLNADKMEKSANLSDVANAVTARTNLGLGNVNNTADTAKPISTLTQAALDLKANASAVSNVSNTSDANKPVSTATQTALNLKQDAATALDLTTAQTLLNKTLTTPVVNTAINFSGTLGKVQLAGVDVLSINNTTKKIEAVSPFVISGNEPAFRAYQNAVTAIGTSNTTTLFQELVDNQGSGFNAATGIFTAPVSGYYQFNWVVTLDGTSTVPYSVLNKNGSATLSSSRISAPGTFQAVNGGGLVYMVAGNTANVVTQASVAANTNSVGYTTQFSGFLARTA